MHSKSPYEGQCGCFVQQDFSDYERNRLLARLGPNLFKEKLRVLDSGYSDGVVAEFFSKTYKMNLVGLDISSRTLQFARERGIDDLRLGDVEEPLPFRDDEFEIVFWGDNIERLSQPFRTLKEINRILKPADLLIVSAPDMGWIGNRIYYALTGMIRRTEGHRNPPWEGSI